MFKHHFKIKGERSSDQLHPIANPRGWDGETFSFLRCSLFSRDGSWHWVHKKAELVYSRAMNHLRFQERLLAQDFSASRGVAPSGAIRGASALLAGAAALAAASGDVQRSCKPGGSFRATSRPLARGERVFNGEGMFWEVGGCFVFFGGKNLVQDGSRFDFFLDVLILFIGRAVHALMMNKPCQIHSNTDDTTAAGD